MLQRDLSRRRFLAMTGAGAAAAALAACGGAASPTPTASSEAPAPTGPAPTPNTDPKEIVFAGRETMQASLEAAAKDVLEANNATMVLAGFGMDQLQTKTLQAAATGTYLADLLQLAANDAGDVMGAGFVTEVPAWVKDAIEWDDIIPLYRERLTSWQGKVQAIVFDGDKHMVAFRGDLAEDPKHQQAFKAKFGYDLPVAGPQTWEERRDLAQYFKETDWRGDGTGVGLADMTDRKGFGWYNFLSRAASNVKHPDLKGALFDADTMEPQIGNEGFVRSLEEWKAELLAHGPKGQENLGIEEAFNAFHGGQSFQILNWVGSNQVNTQWVTYDPAAVRFSVAPGSKEVWNYKTKKFESFPEISRSPFIANGGWTFAVPGNSKQPDLAWQVIAAISNPETSLQLVTSATGAEPSRYSHVSSIDPWVNSSVPMTAQVAESYIRAERESMDHPNLLMDLRIPGFSQYKDALELAISKVLSGQASAGDALREAAEQFDKITASLGGREKQLVYYQSAV